MYRVSGDSCVLNCGAVLSLKVSVVYNEIIM